MTRPTDLSDQIERTLLAYVNSADTPEDLVDRFSYGQREPVTLLQARCILRERDRLSRVKRQFESIGQITSAGSLVPERFRDEVERVFGRIPRTDTPVLLFPVRLETRIVAGELLVRIYPDQIAVAIHKQQLTAGERDAGEHYHEVAEGDRRAAWRTLAQRFGAGRAAWVVRQTANRGSLPESTYGTASEPSTIRLLPGQFHVFVYSKWNDARPKYWAPGEPIPENLALPSLTDDKSSHEDSAWFGDFERAEEVGMAVRIPIDEQGVDVTLAKIVAVGLRESNAFQGQALLEDLLDAHRYTRGWEFVEPGAPTNNTERGDSSLSHSEDDPEFRFDLEIAGMPGGLPLPVGSYARRMGWAFGLDDLAAFLGQVEGADSLRDVYAKHLQTALWPVTGDFTLAHMLRGSCPESQLSDDARLHLARHFREYVRAAGPLPALRVGRLCYGVLPATQFSEWTPTNSRTGRDAEFEEALHAILKRLFGLWRLQALDAQRVPRLGGDSAESDQELLAILGMTAVSTDLRVRLFLDGRFYNDVYDSLDAASPLNGTSAAVLEPLARVFGFDPNDASLKHCLEATPLLDAIAWKTSHPYLGTLTDGAGRDLIDTCEDPTESDDTLLHHMLMRSWLLLKFWRDQAAATPSTASRWESEIELFQDAICSVAQPFRPPRAQWPPTVAPGPTFPGRPPSRQPTPTAPEDPGPVGPTTATTTFTPMPFDQPPIGPGPGAAAATPRPDIDRLFTETLDLCSHRLDAWITSLATKRLAEMRDRLPEGIHLGAYGWVEDLPLDGGGPAKSAGYLFTPSASHGASAAVLYNAFLSEQMRQQARGQDGNGSNPYRINLTSSRVQKAIRLLDGVREGQELGALLGYRFERGLHESDEPLDQYIDEFRNAFPLVANRLADTATDEPSTELAARNVVDGFALLHAWLALRTDGDPTSDIDLNDLHDTLGSLPTADEEADAYRALRRSLEDLVELRDAASDLLMTEAIYQTVRGNHERAGAALEAISGHGHPPEIESMKTPVSGTRLSHRVCLLLPPPTAERTRACTPRGRAEPRLEAWCASIFGDPTKIKCVATYTRTVDSPDVTDSRPVKREVSLADLRIGALDVLYMAHTPPPETTAQTELEQRIACFIRQHDPQVAYDSRIEISFDRATTGSQRTLAEVLMLADAVRTMLGADSALRPGALADPSRGRTGDYGDGDIAELRERVDQALLDAKWLARVLERDEDARPDCRAPVIVAALLLASQFGVSGAVPAGPADPELDSHRAATRLELNTRAAHCERVLAVVDNLPETNRQARVDRLVKALQALFGSGFVVLPQFPPADRESLERSWNAEVTLTGVDQHRIRLWLQQAAQVRPPLREIEDALTAIEAWAYAAEDRAVTEAPPEFQVVQYLPVDNSREPWLALDDDERGRRYPKRPSHALSVVAVTPGALRTAPPESISGILLDQWDELLPADEINTNLTFQHDRPGAQAPNCLLLAVPPAMAAEPEPWTVEGLREIVVETLDLAKARAVDLDALPDVAGALPALFMPTAGNVTDSVSKPATPEPS